MSGIDPSRDRNVAPNGSAPTDVAGAPTTADKYDNTRHLNYGQTSKQDKANKEDESTVRTPPVRRYSASGDSAPTLQHTFYEEIMGDKTGDDLIALEERREERRRERVRDTKKRTTQ